MRQPTNRWTAVAWGSLEASVFFLVPDILITWVALRSFKASLATIAYVLAGSLLGGSLMFAAAVHYPEQMAHLVQSIPFVSTQMGVQVSEALAADGAIALLYGPFAGIPYKVYAVAAPGYCSYPAFLLVSVPARLERLLITWTQFILIGWVLQARKLDDTRAPTMVHAVYWVAVYAYYWATIE